ncbi:hypothetical protein ACX1C1_17265 [Paenibacillus sp. strain BS8-2]
MELESKQSKTSPKRELILLLSAIGIAANAALWMLYVNPHKDRLEQAKMSHAQAEAEASTLQGEYTLAPNEPVDHIEVEGRVPLVLEQSAVIEQLHELSAKSGVLLAQYAKMSEEAAMTEESAAVTEAQTLPFTLTLAGHIESLSDYLDRLQHDQRLYKVKSWSINRIDTAEAQQAYPGVYDLAGVTLTKPIHVMHLSAETYGYHPAAES